MPISDLKGTAQQAGGMVKPRTPDSVAGRSQKGGMPLFVSFVGTSRERHFVTFADAVRKVRFLTHSAFGPRNDALNP
jgi:hypothetical protein